MDVVSGDPLILAIDGLVSEALVVELRRLLEESAGALRKTGAYVDDMFDVGRGVVEDANFLDSVARTGLHIPDAYRADPLRSFLWVAGGEKSDLLADDEVARAADALARRAWMTQWDPMDIAKSGFKRAANRWNVPDSVLQIIAPVVVHLLGTGVRGVTGSEALADALEVGGMRRSKIPWELRDCTVVRYEAGESQVPHMDTCDLTMLVYLSGQGGSTSFPHLQIKVPPALGRILLFSSTVPGESHFGGFAGSAYGAPDDRTLHYGGLPSPGEDGEKMVVQLLFSAAHMGGATAWREVLHGNALAACSYTAGEVSKTLPPPKVDMVELARRRLPLSQQRCAVGCRDNGLDIDILPGEPKWCIYCWRKRLVETLERRRQLQT